jgi:hypothetical protein
MPRKVTAWACKFRCGKKTDTVKSRMVEHEARCRMNPDRRTCMTCSCFEYVDGDGDPYWCALGKRPTEYNENMRGYISKMAWDCKYWIGL